MHSDYKYIFLIVSERSGGNLMLRMMHAHPDCIGPAPTHLIRIVTNNLIRYGDFRDDSNWSRIVNDCVSLMRSNYIHWRSDVSADDIWDNVASRNPADIIRRIYEKEAAAYGRKVIVVKENTAYRFLPFMLANFPDFRFIYMVRDPRDMGLSWKKINWWRGGGVKPGMREGVRLWKENQEASIRTFTDIRDSGRIALVRYEDLIQNAPEELQKMCLVLGIPYAGDILEFYKTDKALHDSKASEAFRNLAKPLMPDNLKKYRKELSPAEIQWAEHYCAREMRLLGYEPDYEFVEDFEKLDAEVDAIEEELSRQGPQLASSEESERRQKRFQVLESIFTREELPIYHSMEG